MFLRGKIICRSLKVDDTQSTVEFAFNVNTKTILAHLHQIGMLKKGLVLIKIINSYFYRVHVDEKYTNVVKTKR